MLIKKIGASAILFFSFNSHLYSQMDPTFYYGNTGGDENMPVSSMPPMPAITAPSPTIMPTMPIVAQEAEKPTESIPDDRRPPECRLLPDGTCSWDQPLFIETKIPLVDILSIPANITEGRCGQTAVANVVTNMCGKYISPSDPRITSICSTFGPGTTPEKILEAVKVLCPSDGVNTPPWVHIIAKVDLKVPLIKPVDTITPVLTSQLLQCPFIALYPQNANDYTGWHYITIAAINYDEDTGKPISVEYVDGGGANGRGTKTTMSFDDFAEMMKARKFNTGVDCHIIAQHPPGVILNSNGEPVDVTIAE